MTRRCFTLLETVLAASLSGVVVLGCMAAFFALERTDQTLNARFHESADLARLQLTMQRSFSTLILAPAGSSDEDQALLEELGIVPGEAAAEPEPEPEDAEEEAEFQPRPRILLEPDYDPTLTSMLRRSRFAQGSAAVAVPQRLELVLSSVPLRPAGVQSTAWSNALVGVEDLESELADGQEEYSGVRGAFVLRPDDPNDPAAHSRARRNDDRIGWTLWWQPLDGRSEPARVASGLAACHFQLFFNREMLDQHAAFSTEAMPTYVQLEVETLTGLYANYLFEIVWSIDALVEEEPTTTTAGGGGRDGGQGGDGAQGGNGAAPGGPGGGQGGGRGGDRDTRGRPRGLTPQGAPAGRPVEGTPRRGAPPPGGRPGGQPGGGGGQPGGGGGQPGGGGQRGGGGS